MTGAALLATSTLVASWPSAGLALVGREAAHPSLSADSSALAQIRAMLDASAAAWNRGDLDGFMRSYAPGDATTFIGRRGIVRGPAAVRAGYAPRFVPGFVRGTLHFEQLEVDQLAPNVANAIAYYVLTVRTPAGTDSTIARGPTSLVMRRLGGEWRIVHDHSS